VLRGLPPSGLPRPPTPPPRRAPACPRTGAVRARAVYQCPHCGTRYLGQQRCPDCNAFCTRTPIRNHLKVLHRDGLAFQVEGRWWRTRFDPEAVVTELQINDTAARKQLTYHRQRRQWWEANTELVDSQDQPLYVKTLVEGHVSIPQKRGGMDYEE